MKKIHENVIAINIGNTWEHELKKFCQAYNLMKEGHHIATECILKDGSRADIIVLDTPEPIAYEIMVSEKEENLIQKSKKYKMRIIGVRA